MIEKLKNIYNKYKEIINYIIVGALTTVVSLVTKYALLFTILSADNAFQLQLSVIISWIAAVLFAYFANRKYVFESKEKNIIKEMSKFFSARIVTLIMESVILWFFITLLKMNSNIEVIIWTLVSQILILIGNYILSKLFVFNKSKINFNNKYINKKNIFNIIMFILLTIICYMFPYTHDDWAWGTHIGLDRLNSLFYNYNGRWLGNLLAILLTRSRIFRAFIISITLSLIVYMIEKNVSFKNKTSKYILISLLLLMPVNIIAQSIAWTAGFTNYVIPVLIVLLIIYLNKNVFSNEETNISNKWILPLLLLGFCCSLFMEHMTIYNVILSIVIVVYFLIAKKKIIWVNIAYAIGAIAGTILMFSNGAYHAIASSQDTYRTIEQGNIISRAIKTYFDTFYKLFIQNNVVLNIFICGVCLYLIYLYFKKSKYTIQKNTKTILYIVSIFFLFFVSYNLFINVARNSNIFVKEIWNKYIEGIMIIFYYIAIITTIFICIKENSRKYRLIFELISVVIIAAPLLIVTPIGPRCFFPVYVFLTFFAIDMFDYTFNCKNEELLQIIKICPILLMTFFLIIYGQIYRIDNKRIEYISKNKDNKELILPKLPYENYMQVPNPQNEIFNERFKLFYGIKQDSKLKFIPYKEWKKGQF